MRAYTVALIALSSLAPHLAVAEEISKSEPEYIYDCKADREFITAYEYLRNKTIFGLNPPEMRSFALTVAEGCTGSAGKFIEITEMLLKARVDGRSAMTTARDVAVKGEKASTAFIKIFKSAYAKEIFDLDIGDAVRVAKRLSENFKGDPEIAGSDFEDLAKFCTSDLGKGLPRNHCATMIENLIVANEGGKLPVAGPFRSAFEFLTSKNETNLAPSDAISIAEKLVTASPNAVDVFRNAYDYASDKSGLALSRAEAVPFATAVAVKTKQKKPL